MVKEISIGIIVFIICSGIGLLTSAIIPKNEVIEKLKNKKVFAFIRYMSTTLLITLCTLLLPNNKYFVLSVGLLLAVIVLMICYDYFSYFVHSILKITNSVLSEKERNEKIRYRNTLLHQITTSNNKDSQEKILNKIKDINKELE